MAADGSGNSSNSGGASDNASGGNADIERMINDAVSKALGARMQRERSKLEEQIAATVQKTIAASLQAPTQAEPVEAQTHGDAEQRLNLKTLDSRFKQMQDRIDAAERKAQEAEERAAQTRLRSDLQTAFSKHAGADNPHLPAYLHHYASQFKVQDGATYYQRRDEFGNEELVPLDMATEQLFKNELKHLIPSKTTPNLPPTSIARGMPMAPQQAQGQGQPRTGFLEQEVMHAQAMTDPTVFAELYGSKKP